MVNISTRVLFSNLSPGKFIFYYNYYFYQMNTVNKMILLISRYNNIKNHYNNIIITI